MYTQTLHLQLDLTIPNDAVDKLAEIVEHSVQQALGMHGELHRDNRRRLPPHQSSLDVELDKDAQLLVDTKQAAKLLRVSAKTLYNMYTTKRMPEPIRLHGRFVRWSLAELTEWVQHGCPPQSEWRYSPNVKG